MEMSAHQLLGKQVKGKRYFHVAALEEMDPHLRERIRLVAARAGLTPEADFNVVKLDEAGNRVSLLYYEHFFDNPFPALQRSCVIDLVSGRSKHLRYDLSDNPPILHRKELLLPTDHPQTPLFAAFTRQLEVAGLFRDARRIGFAREWRERLQSAGYEVREHQLALLDGAAQMEQSLDSGLTFSPLGQPHRVTPTQYIDEGKLNLARHRTALQRYALSAPMQALHRHGYLDGSRTLFDYGCGKGDDVRILRHNGIEAAGWDPHFTPAAPRTQADIINLGFVLNVIEDPVERAQALRAAYALANRLLSVAVMLTGRAETNGEAFGDGVRTSRNTFQKYYT
jgi:hypothetical protein